MNKKEKLLLVSGVYGRNLPEIEKRVKKIISQLFMDSHNFIRGGVNVKTLSPFILNDLRNYKVKNLFSVNAAIPHNWKKLALNYEEADMATGDYLMGLIEKFKVTKDRKVLQEARKVFNSILFLCQNSFKKNLYGKGWLPKPYGGIIKVKNVFECSVDQYTKIALALDKYRMEIATEKERKKTGDILVSFANWWIDHNYTAIYFGSECQWLEGNFPHATSFFLYILALAQNITARKKYEEEFCKIMKFKKALFNIKEIGANSANLTIESLERLCDLKPQFRKLWISSMKTSWDFSQKKTSQVGYCLQELWDGKKKIIVNFNTGTRVACSGASVARLLPQENIIKWCENLLLKCNKKEMFYHIYPIKKRIPKIYEIEKYLFSGHFFTAWFHAHWKLKRINL